MARPRKVGLDYFPFDVDLYDDEKLIDLQLEYGPLGESIYTRLLCLVYKNGYYYQFESLDKLAAMLIRSIGGRWARNKATVKEVILYLAKCNLFSSELMQRNVLTSRGIQMRYSTATGRRQSGISEYNLLEKNDFQEGFQSVPENTVSVTEIPVSVAENSVSACDNSTKEKESKEKENISYSESDAAFPPSLAEVQTYAVSIADRKDTVQIADKFYSYYRETGWKTKNGMPITDWKGTLRHWVSTEKEKASPNLKKEVPQSDNAEAYKSFIYNIDE